MYSYRLLLACFVTLILAPALHAEPTPPIKRAMAATTPVKSTAAMATPMKRAVPARSVRATPEEPGITFNSVQVDGPYIAMTFDDGPSATLTPTLLDLLATRHIKATFFVVGQNVAEHPEIVARAAREGHEIANHSWSHPNLAKMSDENVRRQLQQTDDAIKNATGKRPALMRPPYGSITVHEKHWIHDEFGYDIILWDVDPLDWKRPGPSVVRSRILKETRPGSIVLSHDIHPGTIEAMPSTFDELQAKGFKFVTVSELIRMAASRTSRSNPEPSGSVSPGGPTGFAFPTPSPSPSISPGE